MDTYEIHAFYDCLARVALTLECERRSLGDASLETSRALRQMLASVCRTAEDVAPRNVSFRAAELAEQEGIPDLRKYHWDDRRKIFGDKRSEFHWEHWLPVSEMTRMIRDLEEPTFEGVRSILVRSRICWITALEERELRRLGFRAKRSDPDAAYRAANIGLIHRWQEVDAEFNGSR
jgi:hypothetical protein